MISLIITTRTNAENPVLKAATIDKLLLQTGEDYEVIWVARENHPQLDDMRAAVESMPQQAMVVLNSGADDHCLTFAGLDATLGGDVLLAEADTSLETIEQLLVMYTKNSEIVQVRPKENFFLRFFSWLGEAVYNFGLKINGKSRDRLCSQEVMLLDGRAVDVVCMNPEFVQQICAYPHFDDIKTETIKVKELASPKRKQSENAPARIIGVVGFVYILALLALAVVYPATHGGLYAGAGWWVFLALAVWIGLGILLASYLARQMYTWRMGNKIVNDNGSPKYTVLEVIYYEEVSESTEVVAQAAAPTELKQAAKTKAINKKTTKTASTTKKATAKPAAKKSSASASTKAKPATTKAAPAKATTAPKAATKTKTGTTKPVTSTKAKTASKTTTAKA